MLNIITLIGILVICAFGIGLAGEALGKFLAAILTAAFWGVVLMGFVGLVSSLFGGKKKGDQ